MEVNVKPCLKCPEGQSIMLTMNLPGKVIVPGAAYVTDINLVARALPDCVGHDDGSLEFAQEVPDKMPDIDGYAREGRVFRPLWPECLERMYGVIVRDSTITVAGRCQGHRAEHYTRLVTVDQCRECPARRTNPIPKPILRTAEEFIAEAEAKAAAKLKERLGSPGLLLVVFLLFSLRLFGFVLLLPFGLILLAFFVAHRVTPFWLGPLQFSTSPGSGHLFRGQHIRPPKCSRTLQ